MTVRRPRQRIGIFTADDAAAAMLVEWLAAAGFEGHRMRAAAEDGFAAILAREPLPGSMIAMRAPVVLLCAPGTKLGDAERKAVAETVALPDSGDVHSLLEWSTQMFSVLRLIAAAGPKLVAERQEVQASSTGARHEPALIAIGISTGGPDALRLLLPTLVGQALPPIVIVQHIPPSFVADLAARLGQQTGYRCEIATDLAVLRRGVAYFAPGDHHLRVFGPRQGLRARWSNEDARRGHRPAAEVLFESCAQLDLHGIGVIMTGMGQDGAQGLLRLRERGWSTLGQNEATCAIYGMPRAAKAIGAVEREVPLTELGTWLAMLCRPGSPLQRTTS